jgi:hypothetical protein
MKMLAIILLGLAAIAGIVQVTCTAMVLHQLNEMRLGK